MQILFNSPRSNSTTGSAPCPDVTCCQRATLHRHASYVRGKFDPILLVFILVTVQRWICRACRSTYSVIPEDMAPYRSLPVSVLEREMELLVAPASTPPMAAEKCSDRADRKVAHPQPASTFDTFLRRCLRAIQVRITDRISILCSLLGQLLDISARIGLKEFWFAWRSLGDTASNLVHLAEHFHTSLLLDYKSLRPSANAQIWPKPSPL